MNFADPELEFIDPTPNVHSLFIHFDSVFFWTKLTGKAVVRWSKRMYSCAGVCSYEGRGGICDIALSEPLLKLRPRKDLVETLLHEMIHAYLFVVGKDQRRDGHGPNFLSHMHRINQAAGVNISVYHDFHDEVRLYQNHIWRCNGPCQKVRPYFGIVRRSMNRAPGPTDTWWNTHKRICGGSFIKFKEPEAVAKPVKQPKKKINKQHGEITKYINNNNVTKNKNTPSIKGCNNTNKVDIAKPIVKPFTGSGKVIGQPKSNSIGVLETVRNVWANKTIPSLINDITKKPKVLTNQVTTSNRVSDIAVKKPLQILSPVNNKRLSDVNADSITPQKKIKRIDDYFKTKASSILKDVYGKDFIVTQPSDSNELKAVVIETGNTSVECPICNAKVSNVQINAHIDECLNKDVIEKLSKETIVTKPSPSRTNTDEKDKWKTNLNIPVFKPRSETKQTNRQTINIPIKPEIQINKDIASNAQIRTELSASQCIDLTAIQIKADPRKSNCVDLTTSLPGTSKDHIDTNICLCCGKKINKPVQEHLAECLIFFDSNNTIPEEGGFGDRTKSNHRNTDKKDRRKTIDLNIPAFKPKTETKPNNRPTINNIAVTPASQIDKDTNAEVRTEPSTSQCIDLTAVQIKTEPSMPNSVNLTNSLPGTSEDNVETHNCPCCGKIIDKPVREHLDECLMFFDSDTAPEDSFGDRTIVIDDSDDEFDETQTFNATGTKSPCPCCMKMVEDGDMNDHLNVCLGFKDLM